MDLLLRCDVDDLLERDLPLAGRRAYREPPRDRFGPLGIALLVVSFVAIGGLPPMPSPEATIVVWMSGQLAMLALGFWIACRAKPAPI